MPTAAIGALLTSVRRLLDEQARLVVAVSGGKDSMTLLDAVARERTARHVVIVATMDHGTGPHARAAADLVVAAARARELPVRVGLAGEAVARTEAALRDVRWAFLRDVARRERAMIVTAHTRDDHVETIVMRLLRGAGARGLAALAAPGDVRRPLLEHPRSTIEEYVGLHEIDFVEDPTNRSRAFFRNRVRLDLLPAIRCVQPQFESELLGLSARAAEVRAGLDEVALGLIDTRVPGRALVEAAPVLGLDERSLRALWPAIAGHLGVVLDRRGTERLARFTQHAEIGARMPLSGGSEVVRERAAFTVRRSAAPTTLDVRGTPLRDALRFGRFRFQVVHGPAAGANFPDPSQAGANPWLASLPVAQGIELTVRAWRPGDRMAVSLPGTRRAAAERRVKRFFADAHIVGPLREGWPVVLVDDRVVWVPGVRRAPEATVRAGGASIVYRCEPD